MKKKLNTASVLSEMRQQSVHFRQASKPEPAQSPTTTEARPKTPPAGKATAVSERTDIRTKERTPVLPLKRLSRRYSFEFYDDQIISLKKLKHEAEMEGKKVSLSDMVREALDRFLSETENQPERKSERTE
jgi:hypothetical protein